MRVLVIEDDQEMAETVAAGLRRARMAVDVALDGPAGLERALVNGYDVIVLDRDLPGMHGDEVCGRLVAAGCRSRVLMLTAAAATEDLVAGLGLGADDYLPKPFDFPVLVARIGALFRCSQPAIPPVLRHGRPGRDTGRRTPGGPQPPIWRQKSSGYWSCCSPGRPRPAENCWTSVGRKRRPVHAAVITIAACEPSWRPPLIDTVPRAGYRIGDPS